MTEPLQNKQKAWKGKKYFDIHHPVFWPACVLILLFISITLIVGKPMEVVFANIQQAISKYTGWFFVLVVNVFLVFSLYLGLSKYGAVRLGGKKARPEFSTIAWFAMLFSAGMGIGILFWSVAEPMNHFLKPPLGEGGTRAAAQLAMGLSFLHWGFHAWSIYALVGLSLAFFCFNRNLPLTIRSVFYPLLGDKVHGPIGNTIDVLAVMATLFGLATSLGLGVKQINAGLHYLTGLGVSTAAQVLLIVGITLLATASVVMGIDKGVRRLSELNILLAAIFLVFMIAIGPTLFIMGSLVQNIGYYLQNIMSLSLWTESYRGTSWQVDWTVFYWAWWISWSPFVGMFIARVSKGRTVREFILGVLLVPSVLTFLWLTAFGGSALFLELNGLAKIGQTITDNEATALFVLLKQFPLSGISTVIGVILVMVFFVTSSDSGSLVIDSITAGGKLDAPIAQRIFWANTEGAVAAVLLIGGGLTALQTAAIITGLPFAFVLLFMCYSLYIGLKKEWSMAKEMEKGEVKPSSK